MTSEERKILAARVSEEAGRRLEMLTDKYNLTPAQQALMFPVIARASPSYDPALAIEGESATDAYLEAVRSAEKAAPGAGILDMADVVEDVADGGQDAVSAGEADDPFDAALAASLDSLEARLAPFLDSDQLAQMTAEQVDRYYWWGEVLLKIAGEADADVNAAIAASLAAPATAVAQPVASEPADAESEAEPSAFQGGNLFDLLNSEL